MPAKKDQRRVKWKYRGTADPDAEIFDGLNSIIGRCDPKEKSMQLKDVMTKDVEVVAPDTPLCEAARKMSVQNTTMLPVSEGLKIVGLLTARDLTIRATAQGCDPRTGQVREVMMLPAVYGREDQHVNQAIDLMQRWQLQRLPVLDRQMRLVGIVSLSDLRADNGNAARLKLESRARPHSRSNGAQQVIRSQ
jgi:CBS domain-containing protein